MKRTIETMRLEAMQAEIRQAIARFEGLKYTAGKMDPDYDYTDFHEGIEALEKTLRSTLSI
jgi:soluble cytochrome b562